MNCADFRRQLLIDPRSPQLLTAVQARVCDDAAASLAEALAFENLLESALNIPVPADLAERIVASVPAVNVRSMPMPAASRSATRWWPLALAASLALLALISTSLLRTDPTDALIAVSIEHVSREPYALTRKTRVPDPLVARMFTEAGLHVQSSGLELAFLNRCPLQKRWSVHMVMQAPEGPVTVMYVPNEPKVERMDKRMEMVTVRTLPFADGALVLLAESNRDFDDIESAWHSAAGETVVLAAGSR